MALCPSAMHMSFASAVMKQMNSLTISCIRTFASRAIFASFGRWHAINLATFAIGRRRSCSRSGSGAVGGGGGFRRELEFAGLGAMGAGASWRKAAPEAAKLGGAGGLLSATATGSVFEATAPATRSKTDSFASMRLSSSSSSAASKPEYERSS